MSVVNFTNPELNAEIMSFVDKNEEIWFKASEVAFSLGYTKPNDAVSKHVEPEYKTTYGKLQRNKGCANLTHPCRGGFQPHAIFLSEPGFYQLIFSSKLSSAKRF